MGIEIRSLTSGTEVELYSEVVTSAGVTSQFPLLRSERQKPGDDAPRLSGANRGDSPVGGKVYLQVFNLPTIHFTAIGYQT